MENIDVKVLLRVFGFILLIIILGIIITSSKIDSINDVAIENNYSEPNFMSGHLILLEKNVDDTCSLYYNDITKIVYYGARTYAGYGPALCPYISETGTYVRYSETDGKLYPVS